MSAEDCAPDCDERTACPQVGGMGHWQCGTCPEHNEPRHHCGCMVYEPVSAPERTEAEMAERIAAFEAAAAAPESWTGSQVAVDLRMAADFLDEHGLLYLGQFVDPAPVVAIWDSLPFGATRATLTSALRAAADKTDQA